MTCLVQSPGSAQTCRRTDDHERGHVWHGQTVDDRHVDGGGGSDD